VAGERAAGLEAARFPAAITSTITAAHISADSSEEQILRADEISFHLTDWNSEAAFLVALHLFPERFTPEEIREGVESFLLDVPAHVIAAARLAGYPIDDIFNEGKEP
jgi:hypothetical protein